MNDGQKEGSDHNYSNIFFSYFILRWCSRTLIFFFSISKIERVYNCVVAVDRSSILLDVDLWDGRVDGGNDGVAETAVFAVAGVVPLVP